MDKIKYIKELIEELNKASAPYYNNKKETMTDFEWDKKFDTLNELEKETGIILGNSPTQNAGYVIMNELPKIKHSTPLLSLGKKKTINSLKTFLGNREGVLSRKLDGGTKIINYEDSHLTYLATRGSSSMNEGQDITHNAKSIIGIPQRIKDIEHIQVVGEGIMFKGKFEEINKPLPEIDKYANARNLANASSSMYDSKRVQDREVRFIAFGTLEHDGFDTKIEEFEYLKNNGFEVVEHVLVTKDNLEEEIERMTEDRNLLEYEIDGLVLCYNDIAYGLSLGNTSHHFNNGCAYKFETDKAETILRDITLDIGKSGQLSCVGNFDMVDLCGTEVSNATLNNGEFIQNLKLGIGDKIIVEKGGDIIPQIIRSITQSGTYKKVTHCPICGSELKYRTNKNGERSVHQFCENFGCPKQVLGRLTHFCSRDAMDIRGMSEETIKSIMTIKMRSLDEPFLNNPSDIYQLKGIKSDLLKLERFGKKKVDNLLEAIEKSKNKPLNNVLYGLSIPQCGHTASKKIAEAYHSMDELIQTYTLHDLINTTGDSVGTSVYSMLNKQNFLMIIRQLQSQGLTMEQPHEEKSNKLEGLTFVITGKLNHFENRKALEKTIELLGGKKSSSVSKNTDYLINNDLKSTSGKNKTANDLGVTIISEEKFMKMIK